MLLKYFCDDSKVFVIMRVDAWHFVSLDEARYAPDLFFYIKEKIDANQYQKDQFRLTGSQNSAPAAAL